MNMEEDPYVDPETLKAANAAHDAQHGRVRHSFIRCPWNQGMFIRKKRLTDKVIAKYEQAGYYAPEYKEARKKLMNRKIKRQGNFIKDGERMIYSPL